MKSVYIVTGADGFLGSNVVRALQKEENCEIRSLLLPGSSLEPLLGLKTKIYYGDITNPSSLDDIFTLPFDVNGYVIHCAGIVDIKSSYSPRMYAVNVQGSKNIAQHALKAGCRMIEVSSVHATPPAPKGQVIKPDPNFNPNAVVGLYPKTKAKAASEVLSMVKNDGLDALVVQPSGLMGPFDFGQTNMTQLVAEVADEKLPAIVKEGYNFVDVRDVADDLVQACKTGKAGETYFLCGQTIPMNKLANLVSYYNGSKPVRITVPLSLVSLSLPITSMYYRLTNQEPLYTALAVRTLESNSDFDISSSQRDLNFHPRPIRETVRDMVAFLQMIFRIDSNRTIQ